MTPLTKIENGITRREIHEGIKSIHYRPQDVRPGDMTNFLHNIVRTQINKDVRPPLFDYDPSNKKLKITDSTLYFFLRHVDKKNLVDDLEL